MKTKTFFLAIFLLFFNTLFANDSSNLMDSGKFFVVGSVLFTILIGVFILLVILERKISNLERFLKSK